VYEYVPVMERTFRSGTRESCVAQRSVYVILRGNEETRRYINQVRSELRHPFSGLMHEIYVLYKAYKLKFVYLFLCYSSRPFQSTDFTPVGRERGYNIKIFL
jgi:hypothetical protein